MFDIGVKIKKLRSLSNMSQEKLAEQIKISKQSMNHYETGKRVIPIDTLSLIADFFKVSIESFFSSGVEDFSLIEKKRLVKKIFIISNDSVMLDEWEKADILSFIYLPESICSNCDFATIIKGDSMEPKVLDGDIVLIQRKEQLCNGEIGIFKYKGKLYCKKYRYSDLTKEVTLKSLNEKYDSIFIDLNENTDFKIIGKVVGAYDYNF